MDLEIRHLRLIRTIGESGSIAKAAAVLGIGQGALCRQLQRIEQTLGMPLFVRDVNGVTPTAAGELMISRAGAVLAMNDRLLARVAWQKSSPRSAGPVVIGAVPCPLAGRLRALAEKAIPDGEISVHVGENQDELLGWLTSGRVDAALLREYPHCSPRLTPGVDGVLVEEEPTYIAFDSAHPLANATSLRLADLARESWVLPGFAGTECARHVTRACGESGFEPSCAIHCQGLAVSGVLAGSRLITPSEHVYPNLLGVAFRPLEDDVLRAGLALVWRRGSELLPHLAELAAGLAEAGRCLRR